MSNHTVSLSHLHDELGSFSTVSANNGQSAQTKTAPEGVACDYLLYNYAFFRLATPIKPIRPEPKSQTAAGTGTDEIEVT